MYNAYLDKFERFMSMLVPEVFSRYCRRCETYNACCIEAVYLAAPRVKLVDLQYELGESDSLYQLYSFRQMGAVKSGERVCYYSDPFLDTKFMLKIESDEDGYCDKVQVAVFIDKECMRMEVVKELSTVNNGSGVFSGKTLKDVLIDFFK